MTSRNYRVPRDVVDLRRRVRALEIASQLGHSSIENGAIDEFDGDGNHVGRIGLQPDGSHNHVIIDGPTPLQPTDPTCEGGAFAIEVAWNGQLINPETGEVDAGLAPFADTEAVEVHLGDSEGFIPEFGGPGTIAGEITTLTGGKAEVQSLAGTRWVRLVIRSKARKYGPPSASVPCEVLPLVDPGQFDDLEQDLLDAWDEIARSGAELSARLADAESDLEDAREAIDGAKDRLDELRDTTLPGLQARLEDAEERLDGVPEDLEEMQRLLDAAKDRLDELTTTDLPGLISRLEEAEGDLATLSDTTLPALDVRLDDAAARLDTAFGEGEAYEVGSAIDAARQAAQDAAAIVAEQKASAAQTAAEEAAATHAALVAQGAEDAAIAAAALDAEQKAQAAQQAAEAAAKVYTDGVVSPLVGRLVDAEDALNNLDETTLPALSQRLSGAEGTLDSAFPSGPFNVSDSISTQTSAAQQAAIDAAAQDAQTKANAAQTAAEQAAADYAEGKISESALAVAQAAAADAETKANAAQQAAIDAAATDATGKANAAQQAAIDAAALDATTKANEARSDAEDAAATHADAQAEAARLAAIAAASGDATDKANAAQAAAEATAAADALAKANAARDDAIEAAEAYADLVEQRALSRGTDLVTNGTGYLGDNTNFSGFTVNSDSPPGAVLSFDYDGPAGGRFADELIPVDISKEYRLSFQITQRNPDAVGARHYGMLTPVDSSGATITPLHYMYRPGTTTKLTEPLGPGDTVIHVESTEHWSDDVTNHRRTIIVWDYTDPSGKKWPKHTYSRIYRSGAYGPGTLTATTIPLLTPWTGDTHAAGTEISNGSSGGNYIYITPSNQIVPVGEWASFSGTLERGVHDPAPGPPGSTPTTATRQLPPGTAQVRVGWLLNRDVAGSVMSVAAVSFSDAAAAQQTADAAMVTANGKNLVTYTDVTAAAKPGPTPTNSFGSGRTTNDIHRNRNASTGEIYAEWLWSGSTWQVVNFGDAILRSLDVGKITGGAAAFQSFVAQHLIAEIAQIIELDASKITSGEIAAGRIDVTDLAAEMATVLQLDAGVITTGELDAARINVADLAASIATVIELNANRITAGQIGAERIDVTDLAADMATVIKLDAGRITTGKLSADRIDVTDLAADMATVITLNANRITTGKLSADRIDVTDLAADMATVITLDAGRITSGEIAAERIDVSDLAAEMATILELNVSQLVATTATIEEGVIEKLWTDVVRSRKITTDMLLVGPGQNHIVDPNLTDEDLNDVRQRASEGTWVKQDVNGLPTLVGTGPLATLAVRYPNGSGDDRFAPAAPNDTYRIRARAHKVGSTTLNIAPVITYALATGGSASTQLEAQPLETAPGWHDWQWDAPDDVVGIEVGFTAVAISTGSRTFGIAAPHMTSMSDASLIVDGTIQGRHINAESIAAEIGEFVEISANQITTGTLNAVVTLSGTFQTATSGTRTQINNAGLYHYGASGTLDFSATSAGVLIMGEFRTGVGSNGITISPDSSRLGNGLIEFRSSVTPVNAEVSLVAGTGGASKLQMRGPAITGVTNSPANLDLTWLGSSSASQAVLQGDQVIASGARTIIDATGSSVGNAGGLTLESMAYGGGTNRSRPGVEVKALYTKFTRSGSTGTTEVNVDGDLLVSDMLYLGGTTSSYRVTGAWNTYTPVITATGTNPTMGNTVRRGRWKRIGRIIFFSIDITFGSTFSAGSGSYSFSLPVPSLTSQVQTVQGHGNLSADTTGRWNEAGLTGKLEGDGTITRAWLSADGPNATVHSARGWPSGSTIYFSGMYEAQSD